MQLLPLAAVYLRLGTLTLGILIMGRDIGIRDKGSGFAEI
jgi:hypothetical protein